MRPPRLSAGQRVRSAWALVFRAPNFPHRDSAGPLPLRVRLLLAWDALRGRPL